MNKLRDNSIRRCHNFDQAVKTFSCPRCIDDVYSFGTWLQYYLGEVYHHLGQSSQGNLKKQYSKMELVQLEGEKSILALMDNCLNKSISEFRNNRDKLREASISGEQFQETQALFDSIRDDFFHQVGDALQEAANYSISPAELESLVNSRVIRMYQKMSLIFQDQEIKGSFEKLIDLRRRSGLTHKHKRQNSAK